MTSIDKQSYEKCLKDSKDMIYRAKCVAIMLRIRDKQEIPSTLNSVWPEAKMESTAKIF
jgi:hypothetical protein